MSDTTRVGHVEATRIQVEETGVTVTLRDDVHAQTNHYIKQSRPYFPNIKLHTYIDSGPYFLFLRFARLLFFASLFGALGATTSGIPKELPMGFFIACAVFFSVYCQHEWVNQTSLPVVQKQPVLDDQQTTNSFYELTVTDLKGMALENYKAGIGFVKLTHGKIKVQAFNNTAVEIMSRAKSQSRLMLVLFFLSSLYNFYFMVVAYLR